MNGLDTISRSSPSEAVRRLIINADDLGLSEGTNRGILEAHRIGVVTSASLLVNTPSFETAAREALALPGLSVGLHFNLTVGRPVSPPHAVPTLCDRRTGRFYSLSRLIRRALARLVDPGEVARECAAQIDRLGAAGISITHLDGHQHVHVLPGIWKPVVGAAREAAISQIRIPLEETGAILWRPMAAIGQVLLAAAYGMATRDARPSMSSCRFRGFALTGRRDFAARLLALLDTLPPGTTELMVHPGYPDPDLAGWASYRAGRERELAALTSAAVRARLGRGDIELVSFNRSG